MNIFDKEVVDNILTGLTFTEPKTSNSVVFEPDIKTLQLFYWYLFEYESEGTIYVVDEDQLVERAKLLTESLKNSFVILKVLSSECIYFVGLVKVKEYGEDRLFYLHTKETKFILHGFKYLKIDGAIDWLKGKSLKAQMLFISTICLKKAQTPLKKLSCEPENIKDYSKIYDIIIKIQVKHKAVHDLLVQYNRSKKRQEDKLKATGEEAFLIICFLEATTFQDAEYKNDIAHENKRYLKKILAGYCVQDQEFLKKWRKFIAHRDEDFVIIPPKTIKRLLQNGQQSFKDMESYIMSLSKKFKLEKNVTIGSPRSIFINKPDAFSDLCDCLDLNVVKRDETHDTLLGLINSCLDSKDYSLTVYNLLANIKPWLDLFIRESARSDNVNAVLNRRNEAAHKFYSFGSNWNVSLWKIKKYFDEARTQFSKFYLATLVHREIFQPDNLVQRLEELLLQFKLRVYPERNLIIHEFNLDVLIIVFALIENKNYLNKRQTLFDQGDHPEVYDNLSVENRIHILYKISDLSSEQNPSEYSNKLFDFKAYMYRAHRIENYLTQRMVELYTNQHGWQNLEQINDFSYIHETLNSLRGIRKRKDCPKPLLECVKLFKNRGVIESSENNQSEAIKLHFTSLKSGKEIFVRIPDTLETVVIDSDLVVCSLFELLNYSYDKKFGSNWCENLVDLFQDQAVLNDLLPFYSTLNEKEFSKLIKIPELSPFWAEIIFAYGNNENNLKRIKKDDNGTIVPITEEDIKIIFGNLYRLKDYNRIVKLFDEKLTAISRCVSSGKKKEPLRKSLTKFFIDLFKNDNWKYLSLPMCKLMLGLLFEYESEYKTEFQNLLELLLKNTIYVIEHTFHKKSYEDMYNLSGNYLCNRPKSNPFTKALSLLNLNINEDSLKYIIKGILHSIRAIKFHWKQHKDPIDKVRMKIFSLFKEAEKLLKNYSTIPNCEVYSTCLTFSKAYYVHLISKTNEQPVNQHKDAKTLAVEIYKKLVEEAGLDYKSNRLLNVNNYENIMKSNYYRQFKAFDKKYNTLFQVGNRIANETLCVGILESNVKIIESAIDRFENLLLIAMSENTHFFSEYSNMRNKNHPKLQIAKAHSKLTTIKVQRGLGPDSMTHVYKTLTLNKEVQDDQANFFWKFHPAVAKTKEHNIRASWTMIQHFALWALTISNDNQYKITQIWEQTARIVKEIKELVERDSNETLNVKLEELNQAFHDQNFKATHQYLEEISKLYL